MKIKMRFSRNTQFKVKKCSNEIEFAPEIVFKK